MQKTLTLAEVKKVYGDACFETQTAFGVNQFGKYQPNMTFIVPKTFDLDKDGKILDPLSYTSDKEVTDNMNLNFDGEAAFIFGDFWRSRKGGACFRPKSPLVAKHLLIQVSWGGAFNRTYGRQERDVKDINGVIYFRRANSNGGRMGSDYWVVPVGFVNSMYDPEIDGDIQGDTAQNFESPQTQDYRRRHADLQKQKVKEADIFLKEKAAAEKLSAESKDKFMPRLLEIQSELIGLHESKGPDAYFADKMSFGEVFFQLEHRDFLYNEEGLKKAEERLAWRKSCIAEAEAKARAEATYLPLYEGCRAQIESFGWKLTIDKDAKMREPVRVEWNPDSRTTMTWWLKFEEEDFSKLQRLIAAKQEFNATGKRHFHEITN